MRDQEKRAPENSWADGEVIFKMAGGRSEIGPNIAGFIEARADKTGIGGAIVRLKIQIVADDGGPQVGVIAHTVATHPGIYQHQGNQKK